MRLSTHLKIFNVRSYTHLNPSLWLGLNALWKNSFKGWSFGGMIRNNLAACVRRAKASAALPVARHLKYDEYACVPGGRHPRRQSKIPRGKPSRLGSTFASLKRGILWNDDHYSNAASGGALNPCFAVNAYFGGVLAGLAILAP